MCKVLVVDDEQNMRRILIANLRQEKHTVTEAAGVKAALALVEHGDYEVVVTDQRMPDGSGLDVLDAVKQRSSSTAVIFLTAVGSIDLAVESMRKGAFDFLTKPFSPEVVKATVRRAASHVALLRENELLKNTVSRLEGTSDIYGPSATMQYVREIIARVARTNSTVLITGETGTGKELVARSVHRNSARCNKPFVAVNCAAFTETLLESELFGHERGAFTGADRVRQGLFEAADGGTLFLDEAGEMSMGAQAKLLRVLIDGQVLRVGSTQPRSVDVRVLVATHRDLHQRVEEGSFREDLYYRLAVVPIHLPPLRERREDLPGLCELLSRRVAEDLKLPYRTLSSEAVAALTAYSFPGNVRELRNLIERAYILSSSDELGSESFPCADGSTVKKTPLETHGDWTSYIPPVQDLRAFLRQTEKAVLKRALAAANGAQAEAARRIGLSRSDFGYKMSKYRIQSFPE